MLAELTDARARERIRTELDKTFLVEAAAGTGKTRILIERVIEVLAQGHGELASMVMVTFTEKAAGELKLRIREHIELSRRDCDTVVAARLDTALSQLEEAHISTIHGFCADMLREYPVEAGVDPDFAVEGDAQVGPSLFQRVFERWFDQRKHDLPEGMRRVLRRRPDFGQGPTDQLFRAAETLLFQRDLPARWTKPDFNLVEETERFLRDVLLPVADIADQAVEAGQAIREQLLPLLVFASEAQNALDADDADWEGLEARIWTLWPPNYLQRAKNGDLRTRLREELKQLRVEIDRFKRASGGELAALLQGELWDLIGLYEQRKDSMGRVDFLDLLLLMRDLLRRSAEVRSELQARFSHVFVDEFQDTDPLQAEILLLLCADDAEQVEAADIRPTPGKLFLVGDPKQSIYRFRRADVELYQQIKDRLVKRGDAEDLYLESSFRSVPQIQQAVNAAFEPRMKRDADAAQADYVPLKPVRPARERQPGIVTLPVPGTYGRRGTITLGGVRAQEPHVVAAWISWLLNDSGWTVDGRDGSMPVAPHHVCILFRQLRYFGGDLTRPYADALEARDVPHTVIGGGSTFARDELQALAVLLAAIEWPNDQLSIYATLRGPLFGFSDAQLLAFKQAGGWFNAMSKDLDARAAAHPEITKALKLIRKLHGRRNRDPLAQTMQSVLKATRALTSFALRPNGDQLVGSLLRLVDVSRRFEQSDQLSFRAFVEYVEQQVGSTSRDHGATQQAAAPLFEEGSGGVRMMSVHRAKGLEFPIVVLADVACRQPDLAFRATDRDAQLFAAPLCGCTPTELTERQAEETQRERAEALRLLYVATTRARDTLVVPQLPELPPFESWLNPLSPVLQGKQLLTRDVPGCGDWRQYMAGGVMPPERPLPIAGAYQPIQGEHQVVAWPTEQLDLRVKATQPLRHWELVDAKGDRFSQSVERYQAWAEQRDALLARGREPSRELLSATEAAHDQSIFSPELVRATSEVEVAKVPLTHDLPVNDVVSGMRLGDYIHRVMQSLNLSRRGRGMQKHLTQLTQRLGRQLGMAPDTIDHVRLRIAGALEHPLMLAAQQASHVYREAPVSIRLNWLGGAPMIVEGTVDLLCESDDRWIVIDYKTDIAVTEEQTKAYQRQVGFYVLALRGAFGSDKLIQGNVLFL